MTTMMNDVGSKLWAAAGGGDDGGGEAGDGDDGGGDDGGGDDGSGDIATHARPSHVVAGRGHLASSLWQLQLD